jgi:hypothetical protein
MEYDRDKVDDLTLALMFLVMTRDEKIGQVRAWKGFDWDTMDRLHEKGWISDPKGKARSVVVSEEGSAKARELFQANFGSVAT